MSGKFIHVLLAFNSMFSLYFGGNTSIIHLNWIIQKNCNLEKSQQEQRKFHYKDIFETLSHYISTVALNETI